MPLHKDTGLVLEACVSTPQEALEAWQAGANRLEICDALELDGLTPHMTLFIRCIQSVQIPAFVMIRPRAGHFCYEEQELRSMEAQIERFKSLKHPLLQGFVLGVLTSSGTVDAKAMHRLCKAAIPYPITFHKAIDDVTDWRQAFDTLANMPSVVRILSSGQAPTALEGAEVLKQMVEYGRGRFTIVAAGKITPQNRRQVATLTGATELHGRRIV